MLFLQFTGETCGGSDQSQWEHDEEQILWGEGVGKDPEGNPEQGEIPHWTAQSTPWTCKI